MSTTLDWDLEGFAKFWADIEYENAMRMKFLQNYYGSYGPPCDCGSSVCDECNPGWDQESFEGDYDRSDDYDLGDC